MPHTEGDAADLPAEAIVDLLLSELLQRQADGVQKADQICIQHSQVWFRKPLSGCRSWCPRLLPDTRERVYVVDTAERSDGGGESSGLLVPIYHVEGMSHCHFGLSVHFGGETFGGFFVAVCDEDFGSGVRIGSSLVVGQRREGIPSRNEHDGQGAPDAAGSAWFCMSWPAFLG